MKTDKVKNPAKTATGKIFEQTSVNYSTTKHDAQSIRKNICEH